MQIAQWRDDFSHRNDAVIEIAADEHRIGIERRDLFDHARGKILPIHISQLEIAHEHDLFTFPKIGTNPGSDENGILIFFTFGRWLLHSAIEMEQERSMPKQMPPTSAGETYMSPRIKNIQS